MMPRGLGWHTPTKRYRWIHGQWLESCQIKSCHYSRWKITSSFFMGENRYPYNWWSRCIQHTSPASSFRSLQQCFEDMARIAQPHEEQVELGVGGVKTHCEGFETTCWGQLFLHGLFFCCTCLGWKGVEVCCSLLSFVFSLLFVVVCCFLLFLLFCVVYFWLNSSPRGLKFWRKPAALPTGKKAGGPKVTGACNPENLTEGLLFCWAENMAAVITSCWTYKPI